MVDIDAFLNNRYYYEKEVDILRHASMDPERDSHYAQELRNQVEEDRKTREMVDNLASESRFCNTYKIAKLTMCKTQS
jgi:hypothetical protein